MDTTTLNNHIGKRIRQCRMAVGITLQILAKRLDMSYQQLQKYETGRNRISAAMLVKVSDVLDIPIYCFFDNSTSPYWDDDSKSLLRDFHTISAEPLKKHLCSSAKIYAKV